MVAKSIAKMLLFIHKPTDYTCRRNNNAIFSDRAIFTFPTGAVSQPR